MSRPLTSRPLNLAAITLPCPCGKVKAESLAEAKKLRRKAAKRHGHYNAVRYYQCRWNSWHWSSILEPVSADGEPWITNAEAQAQAAQEM